MEENVNGYDFELSDEDRARMKTSNTKESSFFDHRNPAMVKWLAKEN